MLVTVTDAVGRVATQPLTLEVRPPVVEPPPVIEDGGCVCVRPEDAAPGTVGVFVAALGVLLLRRRRR